MQYNMGNVTQLQIHTQFDSVWTKSPCFSNKYIYFFSFLLLCKTFQGKKKVKDKEANQVDDMQ